MVWRRNWTLAPVLLPCAVSTTRCAPSPRISGVSPDHEPAAVCLSTRYWLPIACTCHCCIQHADVAAFSSTFESYIPTEMAAVVMNMHSQSRCCAPCLLSCASTWSPSTQPLPDASLLCSAQSACRTMCAATWHSRTSSSHWRASMGCTTVSHS